MQTETITAIIVDDEEKARNILLQLLSEHCPEVTVLDQCKNVQEAVKSISRHQPRVVFLDVDMPVYSGFQLLDFFDQIEFDIIFTTAFSEYALQAFRVSALDFLLKPIDIDQLCEAVEKAKQKNNKQVYNKQLDLIRESTQQKTMDKMAIANADGIDFVNLADIVYFQADRAYTKIFLLSGKQLLASKNIKEFEEIVQRSDLFMRVHRSYILNLNHVLRYNKSEGGAIETKTGVEIPLSKDIQDAFLQRMTTR